ncbi:uncharacterized protein LOC128247077 [Octopus bimaculoides]|uniref:uncharacterized protein LOC128247077 n=1 Tax=Octopus bimaculoides TaxID=37653 RepID=UPI0022E89F46|nr:uncharacterized protein LOC128247077 [Octopus bimaculoides]
MHPGYKDDSDAATHQLSIIIRYVYEDKTYERFLGFYEASDDKSATRLADVIATALNPFSDATDKLVSQTYEGAAVMTGTLNGVQSKLRDKEFKHANFIHYFALKLNSILSKSAEKNSLISEKNNAPRTAAFISSYFHREKYFERLGEQEGAA